MLTQVILNGPMGKQFGRKWNLAVKSPGEALRLIDANSPGLLAWVRRNLSVYARYRVRVEYHDGRKDDLDNDSVVMNCAAKKITFTPIVEGARSAGVRFVVGAALFAVGSINGMWGGQFLMTAGASLMIGSVVEVLSRPDTPDTEERKDKTSYQFDGPINTTTQGVPVPLIYGRVLAGSHAVSASISIDQMI